jgi:glycosyltransferase involved in cell wall biosynthesis
MPAPLKLLMSPVASDNPFIDLFSRALRARGVEIGPLTNRSAIGRRADLLLFHWPQNLATSQPAPAALRACAVMLTRILCQKARGAKLVWLAHNLQSSDRRNVRLERLYMGLFTRLVDGVIFLEATGLDLVTARLPRLRGKPYAISRHPLFGEVYPRGPGRTAARARLGLPAEGRVLGFVGDIRDYKNLPGLLQACREAGGGFHLLIAGALHRRASADAVRQAVGALAATGLPLTWVERRLDDEELILAIEACDLVALPYLDNGTINSGFAILALEHGARLLVSDTAPFAALRADLGPPWVTTARLPLQGADLAAALDARSDLPAARARMERFRAERSWEALAEAVLGLAARVTARR